VHSPTNWDSCLKRKGTSANSPHQWRKPAVRICRNKLQQSLTPFITKGKQLSEKQPCHGGLPVLILSERNPCFQTKRSFSNRCGEMLCNFYTRPLWTSAPHR